MVMAMVWEGVCFLFFILFFLYFFLILAFSESRAKQTQLFFSFNLFCPLPVCKELRIENPIIRYISRPNQPTSPYPDIQ